MNTIENIKQRWEDYKLRRAAEIQNRAENRSHPITKVAIAAALMLSGAGVYHLYREFTATPVNDKTPDVNDNDNTVITGEFLTDQDIITLADSYHEKLSKLSGFEAISRDDVLAFVYLMNVNNITNDETQDLIDANLMTDSTKEAFDKATGVFTAISMHNANLTGVYTGKSIADVSTKYIGFAELVIKDEQDKNALIDHDNYMMQLIVETDKAKAEAMAIKYIEFITNLKIDLFDVTKQELGPLVRFIIQGPR
jgi:hypothetical protein